MVYSSGKVKLSISIDIFPTISAAAGLEAPDHLTGINLMDADARAKRKAVFGVMHSVQNMTLGKPDESLQYLWCIEGDWKLLVRYHGEDTTQFSKIHAWDKEPFRLYNLTNDPHEKNNLAESNNEKVKDLQSKITAWHNSLTKK